MFLLNPMVIHPVAVVTFHSKKKLKSEPHGGARGREVHPLENMTAGTK